MCWVQGPSQSKGVCTRFCVILFFPLVFWVWAHWIFVGCVFVPYVSMPFVLVLSVLVPCVFDALFSLIFSPYFFFCIWFLFVLVSFDLAPFAYVFSWSQGPTIRLPSKLQLISTKTILRVMGPGPFTTTEHTLRLNLRPWKACYFDLSIWTWRFRHKQVEIE